MESTQDERLTPSPPAPPASQLVELFQRADVEAAAHLLRVMDPAQARAELPQTFVLAPSTAPACFLRCLQFWALSAAAAATVEYADSDTGSVRTARRLLEIALCCMRGMPQPLASDADAELAGALLDLPALRGAHPKMVADFANAYRVPPATLAAVCRTVLSARAADGVLLLQALREKQVLPVEIVLRAAVEQNDLHAADVYVRRNKAHQHAFVEMLVAVGVPDKLVKKRISAFRLDSNAFPVFVERRQRATLRYLMHSSQFNEALSFVRDSRELQEYACTVLLQQRGPAHAMTQYFVRATGLAHAFPSVVVSLPPDFALPERDDEYEPLATCLSLADCIGAENVAFVDTPEALGACLTHLEAQPVVGFDCEWKATHEAVGSSGSPCATLQLASAHKAFVLDIMTLGDVSMALSQLFMDDAVLKLGFAAQGDLKLLRSILGKPAGGHEVVVSNLLDLQTVARKLYLAGAIGSDSAKSAAGAAAGSKDEEGEDDNAVGSLALTGISELYLGKPLDKRARLSDWERRPLTRAQLHYAALDAHVLVRILAQMQQQHAPELLGPILRQCKQVNLR
ncbi:hypothetical protein PybrP1_009421 [[Pythium] brassicae (nom. inval.)]|nr:hypothetical protein PybrP1_009421 [[Pythium] brassicae (nom. inval.)]